MEASEPLTPQESLNRGEVFSAWFVPSSLPIDQGALVYAQDSSAFDRGQLQVESALFDLLADMPGMGWVKLLFP